MNITYSNNRVEKQCTDFRKAKKDFPEKIAKNLHKVIQFIENADSLEDVINMPTYNFHNLKGDRKGVFAIDIDGRRSGYRLLVSFYEVNNEIVFSQSVSIEDIEIKEVSNHYG